MNRYKPVGWKNDNYRHSLAAKGFTKRHAFDAIMLNPEYPVDAQSGMAQQVQNWKKGNRNKPGDPMILNEKGEMVNLYKYMSAKGIEFKQPKQDQSVVFQQPMTTSFTEEELVPGSTIDTMPTVSTSGLVEQQAQQVEGGSLSEGSVPLPYSEGANPVLGSPNPLLESPVEILDREQDSRLIDIPELATPGAPVETSELVEDRI